jgi:Uma2 family endonuclease
MVSVTHPSGIDGYIPPMPVRRFSVAEYHRLIEAGILGESERCELLEGWIVPKMSRNSPHDVSLDMAQEAIRGVLPAGWRLREQLAITLSDSEPEPDLAVVRGPAQRYGQGHPAPADVAFVAEVSARSLNHDRTTKARIYARAGILIYWVINVIDRQVEVCTDPTGDVPAPEYRQRQDFLPGSTVPLVIGGQTIAELPVTALIF